MSLLVKIGVFLVVILLVVSLMAPLAGPFFQSQIASRIGGDADAPAQVPLNGDASSGRAAPALQEQGQDQDYEIITLLGFDAIPAILAPEMVGADAADEWMVDNEPVVGVSINGDHRAYSIPMLSRHEIVNDVVGGQPVAVTW